MTSRRNAYIGILILWVGGVIVVVTIALSSRCTRQELEAKRDDQVSAMVSRIGENADSTFVVDPRALPVAGEEEEWPALESSSTSGISPSSAKENSETASVPSTGSASEINDPDSSDEVPSSGNTASEDIASSEDAEYTLIAYGTLCIPSIDCNIPLWEGAGVIELRYGAGRMPLSCEAGQPGNLIIFGHRMRRDGSLFNRLGEVCIGDTILIEREGIPYTYLIDQIETIEPSRLSYYMHLEDEGPGCRITLITCTPIGVGTHRLLVIGHLASS
ncbi:MAG: class D sortase [Clostridiales bacterium]|nr:class D sortase [Clostridiales bacterium]